MNKADELFFVVDEHDQPLEPLPRRLVHGHGVWHRVAHIWVFNKKGQVLCQQRSFDKEVNAGYWEPFFGGHLRPDEHKYVQGAVRELKEELGIELPTGAFILWKVYQFHDPNDGYNNEFQAVFITSWDGQPSELTFDDGEVEQVAWKEIADVEQAITTKSAEPWTNCGYELELLKAIKSNRAHGGV